MHDLSVSINQNTIASISNIAIRKDNISVWIMTHNNVFMLYLGVKYACKYSQSEACLNCSSGPKTISQ